jgi:hypothetical protein
MQRKTNRRRQNAGSEARGCNIAQQKKGVRIKMPET